MSKEVQCRSSVEDRKLVDIIKKIRHQKQRPTVDRIAHALNRDYDIELSLDEVEHILDLAVSSGAVTRISTSGGAVSYREPAETGHADHNETAGHGEVQKPTGRKVSKLPSTLNKSQAAVVKSDRSVADSPQLSFADIFPEPSGSTSVTALSTSRRKPTLKVEKNTDLSDTVLLAIERLEVASGKTLEKEVRCNYTLELAAGADLRQRIRNACKVLVEKRRLIKDGNVFQLASANNCSADSPLSQDGSTALSFVEETDFSKKTDNDQDFMTSSLFVCSECKAIEEDRSNVISCAECGVDRHTKCMSRAGLSLLKSVQLWLCPACRPCPICLISNRTRKQRTSALLVCELCDQVYHPECCSSVTQFKSRESSWVCMKCQQDNNITDNIDRGFDQSSNDSLTFSKWDKQRGVEASGNGRSIDVSTHDDLTSASLSSFSVTDGNANGQKGGATSSAKLKLSPHRRSENMGRQSENMSSPDDSTPADVISSSAASQKKRSRNDLSSLFDSLSQFFSTTAERRRRTPFVSSYASDISTAVWLSKKQSSALSTKQETTPNSSLQNKVGNEPVEKPIKAAVSKPAKHSLLDSTQSSGGKASKQKHRTVDSDNKTKSTSDKQTKKASPADVERRGSQTIKTKDVFEADSVKVGIEVPEGSAVNSTKLPQSRSVAGGSSPMGKRRRGVKSDDDSEQNDAAATDLTDGRRVTRRTWLQPSEDLEVDMKLSTHDTQKNAAVVSESLKLLARRKQEHSELISDVVAARVTDTETKLFIMAQTIAQQRLLVSEGVYMLDEQIDCNPVVVMGQYEMTLCKALPMTPDINSSPKLYVCEFCFKCSTSRAMLQRHLLKCPFYNPPGCEIYRHNNLTVFEVEGCYASSYCSSLCLFAHLFVGTGLICYPATQNVVFYVLHCTDSTGSHLVGFITKVKGGLESSSELFVLPLSQHKKYMRFLVEFNYELCKLTSTIGTFHCYSSNEVRCVHKAYLQAAVINCLLKNKSASCSGRTTIDEISSSIAGSIDDVLSTLQSLNLPVDSDTGLVNANTAKLRECIRRFDIDCTPDLVVDQSLIKLTAPAWDHVTTNTTSEPLAVSGKTQMSKMELDRKRLQSASVTEGDGIIGKSQRKTVATDDTSHNNNSRRPINVSSSSLVDGARVVAAGKRKSAVKTNRSRTSAVQRNTRPVAAAGKLKKKTRLGSSAAAAARTLRPRDQQQHRRQSFDDQLDTATDGTDGSTSPTKPVGRSPPVASRNRPNSTAIPSRIMPSRRVAISRATSDTNAVQVEDDEQQQPQQRNSAATSSSSKLQYQQADDDVTLQRNRRKTIETVSRRGKESEALDLLAAASDECPEEDESKVDAEPSKLVAGSSETVPSKLKRAANRDIECPPNIADSSSDSDTENELVDVGGGEDIHHSPAAALPRPGTSDADESDDEDRKRCKQTGAKANKDFSKNSSSLRLGTASPNDELIIGDDEAIVRIHRNLDNTKCKQDELALNKTSSSDTAASSSRPVHGLSSSGGSSNHAFCESSNEQGQGRFTDDNKPAEPATKVTSQDLPRKFMTDETNGTSTTANRFSAATMWRDSRSHTTDSTARALDVAVTGGSSGATSSSSLAAIERRSSTETTTSVERAAAATTTTTEHENLFLPNSSSCSTNSMLPLDLPQQSTRKRSNTSVNSFEYSESSYQPESKLSPMTTDWDTAPRRDATLLGASRSSVSKVDGVNMASSSKYRSSDLMLLDSGCSRSGGNGGGNIPERPASTMSVDRGLDPPQKGLPGYDRYSRDFNSYGIPSPLDSSPMSTGRADAVSGLPQPQQRLTHVYAGNPQPAHQHPVSHLQHLEDLPYSKRHHSVGPSGQAATQSIVHMTPPSSAPPDVGYTRTCQQPQQAHRPHGRQHHKSHRQQQQQQVQSSSASHNVNAVNNQSRPTVSPSTYSESAVPASARGHASPSFGNMPSGYDMFSAACHVQQPIGYFGHHHQGAPAIPMGVVGLHHAQMAVAAAANFAGQQMHAAAAAGAQPNSAVYTAAAAAAYNYLNGGLQPFNVDINTMMRR